MGTKLSRAGSGPLVCYEAGYRAELVERGYKPRTVLSLVRLLRQLSGWMEAGGFSTSDLSPVVAEEFLAEFRGTIGTIKPTFAALGSLFDFLRGTGVVAGDVAPVPSTSTDVTLAAFRRYLEIERGLVPDTVNTYVRVVRSLLSWQQQRDGRVDVGELTARDIVSFVTEVCPGLSVGWAKMVLTGSRSFLGFAHVTGLVPVSLVGAVPSVAGWSGMSLPLGLAPSEVNRLLASCDRRRSKGRRDHAMVLLLARLGLRAAEVAALSLDDVDWRAGEVVIHGKGDRVERLPLPVDVGEAVAGYLRRGRPKTFRDRALFLLVKAPIGPLQSSGVSQAVRDACRRAGLVEVGSHRLRHAAATDMLRSGATLVEVSQVLRHHSAATTAIYAKVDHLELRTLALPWPMGAAR